MRILVTKNGENIFTEEEKIEIRERKFRSTAPSRIYHKRRLTLDKDSRAVLLKKRALLINTEAHGLSPSNLKAYKPFSQFSKFEKTSFNNTPNYNPILSMGRTTNTFYQQNQNIKIKIPSTNNPKKISLKSPKITFPKELESKYELFDHYPKNEDDNNLLEYEKIPEIKNQFSKPGYKYTLGEIINDKAKYKLKKFLVAEERMKEKLSVINHSNFRTDYAYTSKLKKLNEILDYKKIKSDKSELIKYLNTHNNLSDHFLKHIVTSDKEEIAKYDKISQTLLFNKDLDKKFQSELERKVKEKSNLNKVSGNNGLNFMGNKIKLEEEILDKYNASVDRKLNYMEKHKELQKDWKRFGLKHLASKDTFVPRKIKIFSNTGDYSPGYFGKTGKNL